MTGNRDPRTALALTNAQAAAIARRAGLDITNSPETLALVYEAVAEARRFDIIDLWEPQEAAAAYWVLMLSGVNQAAEIALARELLIWQAFSFKESARLTCVQSSDRKAFRACSSTFGIGACPALLLSDTPDMKNCVIIDSGVLKALAQSDGDLPRFLTQIQSMLENGSSLQDVRDQLQKESFYRGLKVAFKEMKGLISISLSPS